MYINSAIQHWIWLAWIHFIKQYSSNYSDQLRIEIEPVYFNNNNANGYILKTYNILIRYRDHLGVYPSTSNLSDYLHDYVEVFGLNQSLVNGPLLSPIRGNNKDVILHNGLITPALELLQNANNNSHTSNTNNSHTSNTNNSHTSNTNNAYASNTNNQVSERKYHVYPWGSIKIYKASECHFDEEGSRRSFQEVIASLPVTVTLIATLGRDHVFLSYSKILGFDATEDYIIIKVLSDDNYKDLLFYLKKNGWTQILS